MTENTLHEFPQDLQQADHPHDEPVTVTFEEAKAALDRKPCYQLIAIGAGLANVAALLHVAYKSVSFEAEDYGDEIFNKSIANGGDAVLIQRILDEIEIINESVMTLRLQIAEGEE